MKNNNRSAPNFYKPHSNIDSPKFIKLKNEYHHTKCSQKIKEDQTNKYNRDNAFRNFANCTAKQKEKIQSPKHIHQDKKINFNNEKKDKFINYSATTTKKYASTKNKTAIISFGGHEIQQKKTSTKAFLEKIEKLKKTLDYLKKVNKIKNKNNKNQPVKNPSMIEIASKNKDQKDKKKASKDYQKKLHKIGRLSIIKSDKKKSKSKKQKKSKSQSVKKKKDFVLCGQQILAISDSQQLQKILNRQKNINISSPETEKKSILKPKSSSLLNKKLKILEKYIINFKQILEYDRMLERNNDNLDILLFKIKDMNPDQKYKIYKELEFELKIDQKQSQPQISENKMEYLLKFSVQIIQRKFNLAKQILTKLKLDHQSSLQYTEKLNKLHQWKSKKFRQIMTAKTFIDKNGRTNILRQKNYSNRQDLLIELNNNLQSEFDEMLNQNFYQPIQSFINIQSKKNKIKKIQHQFADQHFFQFDNNPEMSVEFIQEIKRARQIKEAVRLSINNRIDAQTKNFKAYSQEGILTHNGSIMRILDLIYAFIMENYAQQFYEKLLKPYGYNLEAKLNLIKDDQMKIIQSPQNLPPLLTDRIFVEFQQQITVDNLNIFRAQENQIPKEKGNIMSTSIIKPFSISLITNQTDIDPSSRWVFFQTKDIGEPFPWSINKHQLKFSQIWNENCYSQIRQKILKNLEQLCGILVQSIDKNYLPRNLKQNEQRFCEELLKTEVENINMNHGHKFVNSQLEENMKNQVNYQIYEANIIYNLSEMILQNLIQQIISEGVCF